MRNELLQKNIHLQPEEHVLLIVRKHWFVLLVDILRVLIIGILPLIALAFIAPLTNIHPALTALFTSMWALVVWMMLFTEWTNYYLDVWIVTDKRVINIDQIHLFKRDIITLRIERVQDVKTQTHGFFATLLRFGNIEIQTAGAEAEASVIRGIPDPDQVRNVILEYVDMVTEHKNRMTYNLDKRPSSSE